ncbi:hypothetical protein [Thermoactinospora rubra]|uniref:hypothetical protein n=1 Tax=Thermoactinospora rubra TaxID=1088767 RepID=UPI00117C6479|nr:hypothetical protein [Thermoactinospora rubra]
MQLAVTLRRQVSLSAILAIFLVIIAASPAAAETAAVYTHVYRSDTDCTWSESIISNSGADPLARSYTSADYVVSVPYPLHCWERINKSAGNIAVAMTLFKWTGSDWAVCSDSGFYYNTIYSHSWEITLSYLRIMRRCGSGSIGNSTGSYVYNGEWHGGWNWSGHVSMALAGSEPVTLGEPPTSPAWVNQDGTINLAAVPKRLPVVGASGRPVRDKLGNMVTIDSREIFKLPASPDQVDITKQNIGVKQKAPGEYTKVLQEWELNFPGQ